MWWPGPESGFPVVWAEAHNSPGSTETGTVWALADGETGRAPVNTQHLRARRQHLAVPGHRASHAPVRRHGGARSRTYTVPANSRFTVGVHADFPDVTGGYGCVVESLGDDAGADRRRARDVLGLGGRLLGRGHQRAGDQNTVSAWLRGSQP